MDSPVAPMSPAISVASRTPTGWRRRCGTCPHSAGWTRWCAASRRSRGSRSRSRRLQRPPRARGVSGNGAVSKPSFMRRSSGVSARGCERRIIACHVHPATLACRAEHRVAEQHLVVTVGEGRERRVLRQMTRRRPRRRWPGTGRGRCPRSPRRGRPAGSRRPHRSAFMRAGPRWRISFGRSR